MINILSYLGMSLQSELCLWTLLGILRTIFDATLFKVNANLKQVWQMTMPAELPTHAQRGLRTIISGVMLVQCFTLYAYLAAYIVLLYPVFLEERPPLVLPWLLVAAIRKLLCELMSLALGLGVCVLVGPARPPCIKFLVTKLVVIMPAFYMWMLVFAYYHTLKISASYKTFTKTSLPTSDHDLGLLELAVRRRRTKSLFDETHLRQNLFASIYNSTSGTTGENLTTQRTSQQTSRVTQSTDMSLKTSNENIKESNILRGLSAPVSNITEADYWFTTENKIVPRDTDRILEQITQMMLRVGAYLKQEQLNPSICTLLSPLPSQALLPQRAVSFPTDMAETPPNVGSIKEGVASYIRDYPQIFKKKASESKVLVPLQSFHITEPPPDSLTRIRSSNTKKNKTLDDSDDEDNDYISPNQSEHVGTSLALQPKKVFSSLANDASNKDNSHRKLKRHSDNTVVVDYSEKESKIFENKQEESASMTLVANIESSILPAVNSTENKDTTHDTIVETNAPSNNEKNYTSETLQDNIKPGSSKNPDKKE